MSTVLVLSAALCAALIWLEHVTLARPLHHNENARRVIGVATVLACVGVPVLTDGMDWRPYAFVVGMFAVAGGVSFGIETVEAALAHHAAAERERDEITATKRG